MMKNFTKTLMLGFLLTAFTVHAQDVTVQPNLPASAAPGSTFKVELVINKGDISGFAKLQQDIPLGFSASPDNPNGATFSFKEQKVKFLWMSLPADKSFKVSYNIAVDASVTGVQTIGGSFSYILNNETQKYDIPKGIISIETAGSQPAQIATQSNGDPGVSAQQTAATTTQSSGTQQTEQQTTTTQNNTQNNNTTNTSAEDAARKAADDEKRRAEQEAKRLAAEQTKADAAARKAEADAAKAAKKATSSVNVSAAAPVAGLIYRVQVSAGKHKVSPDTYKTQYNLSDEVYYEEHEGWHKYTVGQFENYKSAKAYSNDIRDNKGVVGPFVTAYKDGTRISVQEALQMQGK